MRAARTGRRRMRRSDVAQLVLLLGALGPLPEGAADDEDALGRAVAAIGLQDHAVAARPRTGRARSRSSLRTGREPGKSGRGAARRATAAPGGSGGGRASPGIAERCVGSVPGRLWLGPGGQRLACGRGARTTRCHPSRGSHSLAANIGEDEMADTPLGFDTLQIHAGAKPDPATGARQTPIYQNTAYVFSDVEHAARLFNLQELGFIYSRLTNPTVMTLAERLTALEGGVGGVCTSSGHAAQIMALFPLMRPGRNIIASTRLYGGTVTQFTHTIRRFGWSAKFADTEDLAGARGDGGRGHPRDLLRVDRQPRRLCHRHPGAGGGGQAAGRAAHRRQHLGDAVPLPAVRAGRRHHRPLDHQVPDRQRHRGRRGAHRLRQLRLVGVGQVPEPDRARARLSRAEVPRDLRGDGLHLPLHRGRACATSA